MTAAVAGAQTPEQHIIAATEIFPDGRVMVFQFLRVDDRYTAQMMIYEDATLIHGERVFYISTMGNQYEAIEDIKQRCPNCHKEIDYSSYVRNTGGWVFWKCQHCGHEWHYSFHEGRR